MVRTISIRKVNGVSQQVVSYRFSQKDKQLLSGYIPIKPCVVCGGCS